MHNDPNTNKKTSFILGLLLLFLLLLPFHVAGQEKDYPREGEGITLFLQRHKRNGQNYYKQFIELNKNKLGKNNSLLKGVRYTIPPLQGKTTPNSNVQKKDSNVVPKVSNVNNNHSKHYEPLFGPKMASYPVNSSELHNTCFYLVCGHGGPDPGAIGRIGNVELHEDEYAYDIILRLARNLLMRGAKVHIIIQDAKDGIRNDAYLANSKRETCMGQPIPFNQVRRLEQRCNKINTLFNQESASYKRAIFIHVDSRSKSRQTDVFFYHQGHNSESLQLAKTMRNTFAHKYKKNQPGRGFTGTVTTRNLYVLTHTIPASLFVELGNIQNSYDQQRIILSDNRQALANWLTEGFVTDYLHHKKKKK